LASTGLIFTGIQEGTQPDGLTQPGQTEQGIPYHVLSCWVPVGGEREAGIHSRLGSMAAGGDSGSLCGLFYFVYSPYLYRCCSHSFCLLFCQTAPILTHQFLPVSFHSPPHPGGGRGGRIGLLLPAAARP